MQLLTLKSKITAAIAALLTMSLMLSIGYLLGTSAEAGNSTTGVLPISKGGTGGTDGLASKLLEKAPLASPALTGTPTAPTATAGTKTTQLATTAFVADAVKLEDYGTLPTITNAGSGAWTSYISKISKQGHIVTMNLRMDNLTFTPNGSSKTIFSVSKWRPAQQISYAAPVTDSGGSSVTKSLWCDFTTDGDFIIYSGNASYSGVMSISITYVTN